jgi:hypothetical protein
MAEIQMYDALGMDVRRMRRRLISISSGLHGIVEGDIS